MDWFLYDNGPRHERVNSHFNYATITGMCGGKTFYGKMEKIHHTLKILQHYALNG